jgi:hypothetical protein
VTRRLTADGLVSDEAHRARGLRAARAATRARAGRRRRRGGGETGYDARPDWRLDPWEAAELARRIEARGGFWAEPFHLAQGVALLNVRSRRRPYPVVRTLRTADEGRAFLAEQQQREGGR